MLTFPLPAALNGMALAAELRAVGLDVSDQGVHVVGDELHIDATDRARVERVLAAHVPPAPAAPTVDLAERLAAVEARLDKAASAAVTGEAAKLRDNLKPAP